MKNFFALLALAVLFFTCKSKDATPAMITGLDPSFEKYLVDKKIDKDGVVNGTMNANDAKSVDSLSVDGLNIKTLAGIEYFVDLKYLYCGFNKLSNLDVSKNINLKILFCGSPPIFPTTKTLTNLDVSKNINLVELHCNYGLLTNLDISNNSKLNLLDCSGNQLSNLDVSKNLNLQSLSCNNNQLSNLDVSKNLKLQNLYCQNNQIQIICISSLSQPTTNWKKDASATYLFCQ